MPGDVWYCLHCGRPARYVGPSFDPAHPLGECDYISATGKRHGCGRVILAASWSEAEHVSRQRKLAEAQAAWDRRNAAAAMARLGQS